MGPAWDCSGAAALGLCATGAATEEEKVSMGSLPRVAGGTGWVSLLPPLHPRAPAHRRRRLRARHVESEMVAVPDRYIADK